MRHDPCFIEEQKATTRQSADRCNRGLCGTMPLVISALWVVVSYPVQCVVTQIFVCKELLTVAITTDRTINYLNWNGKRYFGAEHTYFPNPFFATVPH
jgi:hypothetical protein